MPFLCAVLFNCDLSVGVQWWWRSTSAVVCGTAASDLRFGSGRDSTFSGIYGNDSCLFIRFGSLAKVDFINPGSGSIQFRLEHIMESGAFSRLFFCTRECCSKASFQDNKAEITSLWFFRADECAAHFTLRTLQPSGAFANNTEAFCSYFWEIKV